MNANSNLKLQGQLSRKDSSIYTNSHVFVWQGGQGLQVSEKFRKRAVNQRLPGTAWFVHACSMKYLGFLWPQVLMTDPHSPNGSRPLPRPLPAIPIQRPPVGRGHPGRAIRLAQQCGWVGFFGWLKMKPYSLDSRHVPSVGLACSGWRTRAAAMYQLLGLRIDLVANPAVPSRVVTNWAVCLGFGWHKVLKEGNLQRKRTPC